MGSRMGVPLAAMFLTGLTTTTRSRRLAPSAQRADGDDAHRQPDEGRNGQQHRDLRDHRLAPAAQYSSNYVEAQSSKPHEIREPKEGATHDMLDGPRCDPEVGACGERAECR